MEKVEYEITGDASLAIKANVAAEKSFEQLNRATVNSKVSTDNLTSSFVKGAAVYDVAKQAIQALADSFREGFKELEETNQAMARAQATATSLGLSFEEMTEAAEGLASPVADSTDALNALQQLTQKGFSLSQAEEMVKNLQNIAAVGKDVGQTVPEAMQQMINAFITGRAKGAELARMFPELAQTVAGFTKDTTDAEKMQALFNATVERGKTVATGLADYLKTPAGAMEALSKASENAKEALATGFASALPKLIESLNSVMGSATGFEDAISKVGYVLGVTIVKAVELAVGAFQSMKLGLLVVSAVWDSFKIETLKAAKGIVDSVTGILISMSKLPGVGDSLNSAMLATMSISAKMAGAIGEARFELKETHVQIEETAKTVAALHDGFFTLPPALERTAKATAGAGNAFAEGANSAKAFNESIKGMKFEPLVKDLQLFGGFVEKFPKQIGVLAEANLKASTEQSKFADAIRDSGYELNQWTIDAGEAKVSSLDLFGSLNQLANGFATLGNAIGGGLGKLFGSLGSGIGSIEGLFKGLKDSFGSIAAGGFKNIISGIGGIAGAAGAAISIVTSLVDAISGLFKHDWHKDVKEVLQIFGGISGLSKELTEQLVADAEALDDAGSAAVINISRIADEIGVTLETIPQLAEILDYSLDAVAKGFIDAQQAAEAFESVWPRMAQAALDATGVISGELQTLLGNALASGLKLPGVEQFLKDQIERIKGLIQEQVNNLTSAMSTLTSSFADDLAALIEKLGGEDILKGINSETGDVFFKDEDLNALQTKFNTLASFASAAAAQILAAGGDINDVFAAIGPTLDQLKEASKEFGFELGGLGKLIGQFNFGKKFAEPIGEISTLTKGMAALRELGIKPTAKEFDNFQKSFIQGTKDIGDGVINSRKELIAVKSALIELIKQSEKYGFALDPAIQDMVDLAKKQGIISESDFAPSLSESMIDLNSTLKSLSDTLAIFLGTMNAIPTNVDTTVTTHFETTGEPPPGLEGGRHFAGLTDPITFREPEWIHVDPGETLLPTPENARQSSFGDPQFNPGMDTRGSRDERYPKSTHKTYNFYGASREQFRQWLFETERDNEVG